VPDPHIFHIHEAWVRLGLIVAGLLIIWMTVGRR
jgi:hypothetical protein